jgi:hypothetical protein
MMAKNEFEMMWEKMQWPNCRYYSGICQTARKITKKLRITGVTAEM